MSRAEGIRKKDNPALLKKVVFGGNIEGRR